MPAATTVMPAAAAITVLCCCIFSITRLQKPANVYGAFRLTSSWTLLQ